MKKKIFSVILILLIVSVMGFMKIKNKYQSNSKILEATIYHSEMMGIDAGTEYTYRIYLNKNNTYGYTKSKSEITIAGPSEEKEVGFGKIRNKSDLKKIERDIKSDEIIGAKKHVSYTYSRDKNAEKCSSMRELAEKLF